MSVAGPHNSERREGGSNHPPAEPGALSLVPLEAASGSLRGPDR
jgi:hypothetical protein